MKIDLSTPFLYQSPVTGSASSSTLSCTQLCRLLCPADGAASSSIVTPATLLLAYDAISQSYDPSGWRAANSVAVLSEACDKWHYETSGGVEGPINTRALAKLYYQDDAPITGSTRVYRNRSSAQQQQQASSGSWMQIDELDNLKVALEAFKERTMPSSWPDQNTTVDQMTFQDGQEAGNNDSTGEETMQQNVADELEAFLSSTDHLAPHASNKASNSNAAADDEEEEYESDGGTKYIRDCQTGNWIHEALMMKQRGEKSNNINTNGSSNGGEQQAGQTNANDGIVETNTSTTKKRKRKKPKFSAKSARNWIYITGLPLDTTEEELTKYFSKVGIIDIDPETLKPKVKLYRHKKNECPSNSQQNDNHSAGQLKGDASICYARPESVDLALQILDENLFRDGAILSVQRAKFEQHGSTFDTDKSGGGGGKRRVISESKRRVARLAAIQAVGWDESENGRIAGGLKGLRIIVLMNMFDPRELDDDDANDDDDNENTNDTRLRILEREIHTKCEEIGPVEKITIFSKHPAGVVIVKFVRPNDASDAVKAFNGLVRNGKKVEASFWDGTTDYTVVDVEKEEKETKERLDKFGDWLENQDLPEEFQLRVED